MADHVDYPDSPPISCVTDIIAIIRNDETNTKRDELFHHAWNVQGYLFATFVGRPDDGEVPPKFMAQPEPVRQEFLMECKHLIREVNGSPAFTTTYENDIIEALEGWGLDAVLNIVRPLLKFLYDLIGREWKH